MTHDLKTLSRYYDRVVSGDKSFELRKNDRDFQVGDELHLIEIDDDGEETGAHTVVKVAYILHGPLYGLMAGYCIMSIK
jgi:hypothetical protein